MTYNQLKSKYILKRNQYDILISMLEHIESKEDRRDIKPLLYDLAYEINELNVGIKIRETMMFNND